MRKQTRICNKLLHRWMIMIELTTTFISKYKNEINKIICALFVLFNSNKKCHIWIPFNQIITCMYKTQSFCLHEHKTVLDPILEWFVWEMVFRH